MFGHMGYCVVSIFVAIRQPIYNTQKKYSWKKRKMRHQNSSRNFLLNWEYSSQYKSKSIASYDKTKIPLNLRRKTVSQIISKEE